jgi:hypothetical protein
MQVDQAADASLIDQLASQQLGVQQQAQQEQQAQIQDNMSQPAADPQKPQERPTANEKAQELGAPVTEGDKAGEEPVTYIDVDFGDGDVRQLSPTQIRDTMKRYRDLNYKHQTEIAPNQPILDYINQVVGQARESGHDVSPQEVVQFIQAASQAYVSNPTMGQQGQPPSPQGIPLPKQIDAALSQWEEENAVSLPPMYRDAAAQLTSLQQENAQMRQMMEQILQQAQGINTQAQQQVMDAGQQAGQNMRMLAANNLNSAQQKHQLPDEAEGDFFTYAFERGYTIEDFVDPQLTDRVMGDFRNAQATPEMERLRRMAQRRTAYTGNLNTQPSMGGAAPNKADPNQSFIDSVTNDVMQKRNML